ncbi:hypothetical protein [Prosthecomicrobium hirschii]|uniref:hypothetical protein n=1 Tax=Prosthecodimorpha hirschii TaxID=665126 RepID=UPI00221EEA77|nr:hypothetical protein [Prosthecomicrobium hirschii]MCW1841751.1 hypothetical protein [Prosthecomicrobium hirschii]
MTTQRYLVSLLVGRELTRVVDARTPELAEEIATFLFREFGAKQFEADDEDIVDISSKDISVTPEGGQ